MRVDQPGHDCIAVQIEYPCMRRDRAGRGLNSLDVIALDQHGRVFERSAAGAIDHAHMG